MTEVTPDQLTAWADGQLHGAEAEAVAAAVAADTGLQAQVEAHRALKARLSAHFAPIAEAPLPDRLTTLLQGTQAEPAPAGVSDIAAARARREDKRRLPRWSYIVGPALAATLLVAVFVPRGPETLAESDPALVLALDEQLVADQDPQAETRVLLSFRNDQDQYCRAFSQPDRSGIACREDSGWALQVEMAGERAEGSQYRQAGAGAILAAVQDMASGPALTAAQESAAHANGWQ